MKLGSAWVLLSNGEWGGGVKLCMGISLERVWVTNSSGLAQSSTTLSYSVCSVPRYSSQCYKTFPAWGAPSQVGLWESQNTYDNSALLVAHTHTQMPVSKNAYTGAMQKSSITKVGKKKKKNPKCLRGWVKLSSGQWTSQLHVCTPQNCS